MSSKFLIELGQGTVSVEGEEDFVKAAFCALQSILTITEPAGSNDTSSDKVSKATVSANDRAETVPESSGEKSAAKTAPKTAAEEFGNPGEILERIRDSLTGDEDDKEAVA